MSVSDAGETQRKSAKLKPDLASHRRAAKEKFRSRRSGWPCGVVVPPEHEMPKIWLLTRQHAAALFGFA
jgi:hypothetical protein